MEIKAILIALALGLLYLVYLFFTNKEKFKSTVKLLTHQAEWLFSTGVLKREWVNEQIDKYVSDKFFITKFVLKFIVKIYADKFIEKEVVNVNSTTKHVVEQFATNVIAKQSEKLLESEKVTYPKDSLVDLAKELKMEPKDRAFFVGEAGINGNTSKEGVDYFAKIGVGGKL